MANPIHAESVATQRWRALLRHEWKIVSAGLSAISGRPLDLLTLVLALPVFLFVVRAWTAGQSQQLVSLQAGAVGFAVAFFCVRALLGRCTCHRTDGIMAAYAQRFSERLSFALPLFCTVVALGHGYLLIVNAHSPAPWLAATLLGTAAGLAWTHIARLLRERQPTLMRWVQPRLPSRHRTWTMLAAGAAIMGVVCALLPVGPLALMIVTAAISSLVSIVLGQVDASEVHYRTMVGHRSWVIIRSHIAPLVIVFTPFAAALAFAPHWGAAPIAAVIGLAVTVFIAMRVFAYQSFHQRIADWFVTALTAVSALTGLAFPPAAPLALLLGFVWLARRAARQTWLIA